MKLSLAERMVDRKHWVYRHYDAADRLLYVGCTSLPKTGPRRHRGKSWWPQVVRTVFSDPLSYWAARTVEHRAIANEHPLHNKRRWGALSQQRAEADAFWRGVNRRAKEAGLTGSGVVIRRMAEHDETVDEAIAQLVDEQREEAKSA